MLCMHGNKTRRKLWNKKKCLKRIYECTENKSFSKASLTNSKCAESDSVFWRGRSDVLIRFLTSPLFTLSEIRKILDEAAHKPGFVLKKSLKCFSDAATTFHIQTSGSSRCGVWFLLSQSRN